MSDSVNQLAEALEEQQSFFNEAVPTQAFAKVGILGGEGDGKTHTAVAIACGFHQELASRGLPEGRNRIAFLESSEFGLDFHLAAIKTATGHAPLTRKTRAFSSFVEAMRAAVREKLILIVDSVTHFYTELQDSYREVVGRDALTIEDLGIVNRQWADAMELFKSGAFHCILTGRRGWEWGHFENEATGRRELERVDVKMKGGGDTGYECSLLVHMKRATDASDPLRPRIFRVATVIKDRAQQIDGMSFSDPTYADFAPHFTALNLGGVHRGVDDQSSKHLIADPRTGKRTWEEKQCTLDEIDALLGHQLPGQDAASKKSRADALQRNFGTLSKERLGTMHLEALRRGYRSLHVQLTGVPPVMPWEFVPPADAPAAPAPPEVNDPMSVAMRQGADGRMVSVEEYNKQVAAAGGVAQAAKDAGGVHTPTLAKNGEAEVASAAAGQTPAPAPAAETAAAPVRKKPGRKPKAAQPTPEPASDAQAPTPAPVPPVSQDAVDVEPPDTEPRPTGAYKPAPGSTDPQAVLAEVAAPAEPAPRKKLGRPRKNPLVPPEVPGLDTPTEAPAGFEAPKKRGRPPGSKNRPKGPDGQPIAPDAPVAPATPATPPTTQPPAPTPAPFQAPASPPPAPTPPPAADEADAPHDDGPVYMPPNGDTPAIDSWGTFMTFAPAAAQRNGITAPQFARGLTATLSANRFLGVKREALPVEFLKDFHEAIVANRWDTATGVFNAPATV